MHFYTIISPSALWMMIYISIKNENNDYCTADNIREALLREKNFLSGIAQITSPPTPSPQFGQVVQLFLDVKNDVFMRITCGRSAK